MKQNNWLKLANGQLNWQAFFIREQVIKAVRSFFDLQKFHEVDIPVLQEALPLEPTLYAFQTQWQKLAGKQTLYLPLSPETALKKMLAAGIGNCYALGKTFRNLEANGPTHNPEFLMLEWYRENVAMKQIMADTQALVLFVKEKTDQFLGRPTSSVLNFAGQSYDLAQTWPKLSLEQLFKELAHLEIKEVLSLEALSKAAAQKNYAVEDATWEQLFNQIFVNEIEPHLPTQAFFLVDFPAQISPLCKPNAQKPYLANRFEIYLAGLELGNGNDEQTNVEVIKKYFDQEKTYRQGQQLNLPPLDQDFLQALEILATKQINYAGIGLGVDRLAMIMADQQSLSQVNLFAF